MMLLALREEMVLSRGRKPGDRVVGDNETIQYIL